MVRGEQESAEPGPADAITPDELAELRPGAGERLHRNVLFAATGTGTTLSLLFWMIGAGKDSDSIGRVVVPLLVLVFGALTWLIWRGRLRGAKVGLLALGGGVLLERIHFVSGLQEPGFLPVLDAYELLIWLPSVFVFAFLLFERRHALVFSLALVGGSLFILRDWLVPGADGLYHADLTEFYIGLVSCVVLVYGFARLKSSFLATHKLAVHLRGFAETDFLTGVSNRRALTHALERELFRCERHGGTLAVVLLDVDHFKRVNDELGHDVGDKTLRRVAMLMDRNRRQSDLFGRWGGEEFLLVAPQLDIEQGRSAAERMRALIEASHRDTRASVTASFGVSEYRSGDDVASLVKRADECLMTAKETGRNRVVASGPRSRLATEAPGGL